MSQHRELVVTSAKQIDDGLSALIRAGLVSPNILPFVASIQRHMACLAPDEAEHFHLPRSLAAAAGGDPQNPAAPALRIAPGGVTPKHRAPRTGPDGTSILHVE